MKALKTLLLTKTAAAAAACVWLALPVTAHASESQGVSCPADSAGVNITAEFIDDTSAANRDVLKCRKVTRHVLESICLSPGKLGNLTMNANGSDTCLASITGSAVPSVMRPPVPGIDPPASAFQRVVNPTGPDTFVATRVSYVFPVGGPVYIGNESHGVRCPAGLNPVHPSANVLRCEAVVARVAGCDLGWTISHRNGRDLCLMGTLFGTLTGDFTIPANAGYTGLIGNPDTHGWGLRIDNNGGINDIWVRDQKSFGYPEAF